MIAPAIVPGRQVHKGVAVARQRRGSVASSGWLEQRTFAESIKLPAIKSADDIPVDVYRNYDLNIELNMNILRFFLGMEETESYPITA